MNDKSQYAKRPKNTMYEKNKQSTEAKQDISHTQEWRQNITSYNRIPYFQKARDMEAIKLSQIKLLEKKTKISEIKTTWDGIAN